LVLLYGGQNTKIGVDARWKEGGEVHKEKVDRPFIIPKGEHNDLSLQGGLKGESREQGGGAAIDCDEEITVNRSKSSFDGQQKWGEGYLNIAGAKSGTIEKISQRASASLSTDL